MAERPSLVVVGAASRDLDTADPRGWRLGGGVAYSALAAARLGVKVRAVIGLDDEAGAAHELALLADAGVDVHAVHLQHGPVFENRQTPRGRVQFSPGPSDPVPVAELPPEWRSPVAAILAPVAGEVGDDWATAFAPRTRVVVAVQGLVRRLVAGAPVEARRLRRTPIVERADALLISAEDLATETPALDEILKPGQELVATHGDAGALWVRRLATGITGRYVPALPERAVVDATGAGDIFLGSWVAAQMLLPAGATWQPLAVAAAMGSLSVRSATLSAVPSAAQLCHVLLTLRDARPG